MKTYIQIALLMAVLLGSAGMVHADRWGYRDGPHYRNHWHHWRPAPVSVAVVPTPYWGPAYAPAPYPEPAYAPAPPPEPYYVQAPAEPPPPIIPFSIGLNFHIH
jgi:hypothetical protein